MWTYSPSDVTFTYAGRALEGFSDNTFISISRESPLYSSKRAMDGTAEVVQQRYSKWVVILTLTQSSTSNDFLSAMQQFLFDNKISAMEYLPLIIKDNSGNTTFFAKDVWIEELPEQTFSDGMGEREWRFVCNDVYSTVGGNGPVDGLTEIMLGVNALYNGLVASNKLVKAIGGVL